jgi:hypothetical protein
MTAMPTALTASDRIAEVQRNTAETQIGVRVNLDGTGAAQLSTGIGFFDHMLDQIARHGLIDLDIQAKGDLHIDGHHTVEDVGITLGQAFAKAVGDKKASAATDMPMCPWTRRCPASSSISRVARACTCGCPSRAAWSAALTRSWRSNFFRASSTTPA